MMSCLNCGNEITNHGIKFCSSTCSAVFNNKNPSLKIIEKRKKKTKVCRNCSNPVYGKQTYCSKNCQKVFKLNLRSIKEEQILTTGMSCCTKCKTNQPISNFTKEEKNPGGINSWCKNCITIISRQSYKKYKDKFNFRANEHRKEMLYILNIIKSKHGCTLCGLAESYCLEFHHINNDKFQNVAKLATSNSKLKIFQEINKCVVICANCHKRVHSNIVSLYNSKTCNENIDTYFNKTNKGREAKPEFKQI